MAVKPTPNNSLYKGFTFDGIDSRDYGVYISGDAVFDSPERDVEMIEIPGRNGSFALDKGRFGNITVSYPAGIFGEDEASFREGIRALRNALASRKGYCRLEDDYNPNEYRMAVYKKGLEVDPALLKAGEFTIEFDCQPQRFLKSGENPRTIGGSVVNTQTKSGAVVALESDGGDKVTSLVAQIEPVQAGSGDPSPTNVRPITGWTAANVNVAGKNLLGNSLTSQTKNGVTATVRDDGSVVLNGTASAQTDFIFYAAPSVTQGFKGSFVMNGIEGGSGSTYSMGARIRNTATNANRYVYAFNGDKAVATSDDEVINRVYISVYSNANVDNVIIRPMLRLATETDATYEPYKGHKVTVSFGSAGTVYGGTLDVVTGVLTVKWAAARIGALAWGYNSTGKYFYTSSANKAAGSFNIMSDIYATATIDDVSKMGDYHVKGSAGNNNIYVTDSRYTTAADFKTANDQKYVYLELPASAYSTYNLTAQQVELLTGNNNVWADTGDITLTYGADPNKIVNPTLFESHPLLMTKGYGNITIGTDEIDINNDPYGRLLLANAKATGEDIALDAGNMALLNTGDAITVSEGTTWRLMLIASAAPSTMGIANITANVSGTLSGSVNAFAQGGVGYIDITLGDVGFVKGTTKSLTMTLEIGWTNNQGTTYNATAKYGCQFRANTRIRFLEISRSGVESPYQLGHLGGHMFKVADIYGDSTKTPLDETVYIDTDIGEAYTEAGGVVSSANALVSLPAKLPTLKSGVNNITYDDTITQFKIVPRWWEV